MSALIAAKEDNIVIVGSDGLLTDSSGYICSRTTKKWKILNNRAIGSAGSLNILNEIDLLNYDVLESPHKVIDHLSSVLEHKKWAPTIEHNIPYYGSFEIGLVVGQDLYVIDSYFSITKCDIISLGSREVINTAMDLLQVYPLKERITKSIEACINSNVYCGGTIYIDTIYL